MSLQLSLLPAMRAAEPADPARVHRASRRTFTPAKPHCACGCTYALEDGTPTDGCECWMVHHHLMFDPAARPESWLPKL